jgi:hypothetical protein
LYPATPDRIERLKVGVTLTMLSRATGHSVSLLSLIERNQLSRPLIRKKMRDFIAAHAAK